MRITDQHGIPAYITGPGVHSRFLGVPAMQNRFAVPLWSYFAELAAPARIIELGAYDGGLSIPLAILCRNIGARFVTYENASHRVFGGWDKLLGFELRKQNIFTERAKEEIAALIAQPGLTWLLCDNGSKEREWATFAPYLKPGDVIGAHDWCDDDRYWICKEFYPEHLEALNRTLNLAPVTEPQFENAAWFVMRKAMS